MPEYPPKLRSIEEAEFGSVLNLSDGRNVPINIRPSRLAEALAEYQSRTLTEMVAARSLAVFADLLQTSEEEWNKISNLIRTSRTAETILRQHPTVWSTFHEPYNAILVKPHRIYGGLQVNLYTSHPFFVTIITARLRGVGHFSMPQVDGCLKYGPTFRLAKFRFLLICFKGISWSSRPISPAR